MLEKKEKHYSNFSISIFFLIIITIVGFIIRIYYMPENIPLTLDALRYFFYGMDVVVIENLPRHFEFPNNGWPLFLSILFQAFRFENSIDYMTLQKVSSIIFSTLTAIPIYFLTKKFFNEYLALIATSFFIFSPYIVENSFLGLTESLFIFLIANFLALFFSKNKIHVIFSFVILGISSIVRYESLLLIIPVTVIFFHKYKSDTSFRKLFFIGLGLFLLVIISMALWRFEIYGNDGFISHFFSAGSVVNDPGLYRDGTVKFDLVRGFINLPKFIAASLLPICFIFVPYSLISLTKKENKEFRYLVLIGIFALIPALYAYGRGFEDSRYVFIFLPIFVVSSLFLIQKIVLKTKKRNAAISVFIVLIAISSIIYIDSRQPDYEHEYDAIQVAKFVDDLNGGINDYGKETRYVEFMRLDDVKFPALSTEIDIKTNIVYTSESINRGITIHDIMEDARNKDISYLAITDYTRNNNQILSEIYDEPDNYPYLEKIFDSKEHDLKFNIKIFKINFLQFGI